MTVGGNFSLSITQALEATQLYSLADIVALGGSWHRGIPIQAIISEPLEEELLRFDRPLLVSGPPNIGKTCWIVRQAWHWLQLPQAYGAAVFLIKASEDDPALIGKLVRGCPPETSILMVIDDVHFARSNLRPWIDELEMARHHCPNIFIVWVARDTELRDQLRSDSFEEPELYRFSADRVLDVLGKRLYRFKEWQRVAVALETGLDPRLARQIPPRVAIPSNEISEFVNWVGKRVREDIENRVVGTRSTLNDIDDKAFDLYTVLLPAGSINYPFPAQFLYEIGYSRLSSMALIQTGLAKVVGQDNRLVLTEHPFQIRQILNQEGLFLIPSELRQWFSRKFPLYTSFEPSVTEAVLAGYLADLSQASTRLDDLVSYAERSGVRQTVSDALKLLVEHTDWSVNSDIRDKATADYHTLTRRSFPDDEERLRNVLKNQQAHWEELREAAERSGKLKTGSERLDRILYEIAYIDYLCESYDQASEMFHRSVDAALEIIARGMQGKPDDSEVKDGSDALARFWISALLENSATLRHHIRQCLSTGEIPSPQCVNILEMSRLVKEVASLWRALHKANHQPKEYAHPFYIDALRLIRPNWQPPSNRRPIIRTADMEKWLARHENNAYLHSREISCWPMLFMLSNQRMEIDVPEPEEHQPGIKLSAPDVGLPFYRAQGVDLLCRWAQHSEPSELSNSVLAAAAMRRAGGDYEYLGDTLLLAWRCTPSTETADMLEWYLHNRVPSIGFNGLPKIAIKAIGSSRRNSL